MLFLVCPPLQRLCQSVSTRTHTQGSIYIQGKKKSSYVCSVDFSPRGAQRQIGLLLLAHRPTCCFSISAKPPRRLSVRPAHTEPLFCSYLLSVSGATRLWYVWLSHPNLPPPPLSPAPPSVPRRQIRLSPSAFAVLEVGESAGKQKQEGG